MREEDATEKMRKLVNAPVYDKCLDRAASTARDPEVYVGPDWIREGRHVDQPMLDKRLTEEEIIARAGCRAKKRSLGERELSHAFWWFLVPALIALVCAAYLFELILKGLKGIVPQ